MKFLLVSTGLKRPRLLMFNIDMHRSYSMRKTKSLETCVTLPAHVAADIRCRPETKPRTGQHARSRPHRRQRQGRAMGQAKIGPVRDLLPARLTQRPNP